MLYLLHDVQRGLSPLFNVRSGRPLVHSIAELRHQPLVHLEGLVPASVRVREEVGLGIKLGTPAMQPCPDLMVARPVGARRWSATWFRFGFGLG